MLADDGYQWFVEQGGLTRENGQRFRKRFCRAAIALI
jgi:peptidyl-dipeptidase Dcp